MEDRRERNNWKERVIRCGRLEMMVAVVLIGQKCEEDYRVVMEEAIWRKKKNDINPDF